MVIMSIIGDSLSLSRLIYQEQHLLLELNSPQSLIAIGGGDLPRPLISGLEDFSQRRDRTFFFILS
jgi:hypothetical protein